MYVYYVILKYDYVLVYTRFNHINTYIHIYGAKQLIQLFKWSYEFCACEKPNMENWKREWLYSFAPHTQPLYFIYTSHIFSRSSPAKIKRDISMWFIFFSLFSRVCIEIECASLLQCISFKWPFSPAKQHKTTNRFKSLYQLHFLRF